MYTTVLVHSWFSFCAASAIAETIGEQINLLLSRGFEVPKSKEKNYDFVREVIRTELFEYEVLKGNKRDYKGYFKNCSKCSELVLPHIAYLPF